MGVLNDNTRLGISAAGTYEIDRSLRFNGADNAGLSRTFGTVSTADNKTWTVSLWTKRSKLATFSPLFGYGTAASGSSFGGFYFASDDTIHLFDQGNGLYKISQKLFRDTSAWYHIVVAVDAANTVSKAWVNGVELTYTGQNTQPSNTGGHAFTSSAAHYIGNDSAGYDYDGYIADMHICSGLYLDHEDFGKTDPDTGQWIPIKYTGGHGTHGSYLNFSDNSNTTSGTLGADSSANSNDWTPTNFSVTAGTGNDSVVDTPTNNYCVLNDNEVNGAEGAGTLTQGGLEFTADNNYATCPGTFSLKNGKYYWEVTYQAGVQIYGIMRGTGMGENAYVSYDPNNNCPGLGIQANNGTTYGDTGDGDTDGGPQGTSINSLTTNDVMAFASDIPNGTLKVYKNDTLEHTFTGFNSHDWFPAVSGYAGQVCQVNFGSNGFKYTPPTDYVALCAANLPEPTIKNGSKHMKPVIYEGTGSKIDYISVGFQPDLTWIKNRDDTDGQIIQDSARGNKVFTSIGTTSEGDTGGGWVVEVADGFTADANGPINTSGESFVAWCWKESATAGFDIVLDTGTGADKTVAHSLGVKPDMMIRKARDRDDNWCVYHKDMDGADATEYLELNTTNGQQNYHEIWNDTAPTSSVFSVGSDSSVNDDTKLFVTYLFSSVEGYSKMGLYKGNSGGNEGTFVYTGFKPSYVTIKRRDGADSWYTYDSAREPINPLSTALFPNGTDADYQHSLLSIDFLSNGFKIRATTSGLSNSESYIYMAFAETSFKYATAR